MRKAASRRTLTLDVCFSLFDIVGALRNLRGFSLQWRTRSLAPLTKAAAAASVVVVPTVTVVQCILRRQGQRCSLGFVRENGPTAQDLNALAEF